MKRFVMLALCLSAIAATAGVTNTAPRVFSRTLLDNSHIVVQWSDGRIVTNEFTRIPGDLYVITKPAGQTVTNKVWWDRVVDVSTTPTKQTKPDVWLTAERREALKKIAARPYVVKQVKLNKNTVVYYWTNSVQSVTTNTITRTLGKPSKSEWGARLETEKKARQDLINELKTVKDKPTKKGLETIIDKHSK